MMGLDIYLERSDNWTKALADEAEYEAETSRLWDEIGAGREYKDIPESDKETIRAKSADLLGRMGLVEYGKSPLRERIDAKSAIDPTHICEIGYLRSSYNEGGFNRKTHTLLGLEGFYHIFGREREDDYHFEPDWAASRVRASAIADRLAEASATDPVGVSKFSPNMFRDPRELDAIPDEQAALRIYQEQMRRHKPDSFSGGSYGTGQGDFFLEGPLQVKAIIFGTDELIGRKSLCAYVVYVDESMSHYVNSARIAAEMCDFVLTHPRPDTFRLAWSS